jgi:hypothetical protein
LERCVRFERPRRGGVSRPGRRGPLDEQPFRESIRRPHHEHGQAKELNENLAPLRRYLERRVGRPWNKIYAEIAAHLRADNTVQQHVRDHIQDFVALKPRHIEFAYRRGWYQRLYVDQKEGFLKRTERLLNEKARRRRERLRQPTAPEQIRLTPDRELRRIEGFWSELCLAEMPKPVYETVVEHRRVVLKRFKPNSPHRTRTSPALACDPAGPGRRSRVRY